MPASLFFGAPAAAVISLLGSDVGRGHAFYLDGVERELRRIAPQRVSERASVFEISRGLGGLGWKSIRAAYYAAGLGSPAPALYAWLRSRSNYDSDSPILRILGHHLRLWADAFEIVVVDDGLPSAANCTIDAGEVRHSWDPVQGISWGTSTGLANGAAAPDDEDTDEHVG